MLGALPPAPTMSNSVGDVAALSACARTIIERESTVHDRRVRNVELRVESDNIAVQLDLDQSPALIYLGVRASTAAADLSAFDAELRRIIRLIFEARPYAFEQYH